MLNFILYVSSTYSLYVTISTAIIVVASIIIYVFQRSHAKKLPPYNPGNLIATTTIFTGPDMPEYILRWSKTVGNVLTGNQEISI